MEKFTKVKQAIKREELQQLQINRLSSFGGEGGALQRARRAKSPISPKQTQKPKQIKKCHPKKKHQISIPPFSITGRSNSFLNSFM
eukprot:2067576-Amphidinium_carterae.1